MSGPYSDDITGRASLRLLQKNRFILYLNFFVMVPSIKSLNDVAIVSQGIECHGFQLKSTWFCDMKKLWLLFA